MNIIISIVAVFAIMFFMMQFLTVRMAKRSKGTKLKGLTGDIKDLEKHGSKGLVYFYSPTCAACRAQTPVIKELQTQHRNIFDIDISRDYQTAQIFGIKATPTTVSVQDGIIKEVLLGAKPKQIIERMITN